MMGTVLFHGISTTSGYAQGDYFVLFGRSGINVAGLWSHWLMAFEVYLR